MELPASPNERLDPVQPTDDFVHSPIHIVEALVLEPGGKRERHNDGQGNLNKRLLEDIYGCRIHLLYSKPSFAQNQS
jgi:hypothetical protein